VLNSIYGVLLKPEHRELGRELLPLSCLNSITLLGAEIVGRAYGGGVLKLEPKEADRMPVPSVKLIDSAAEELRAIRPQLTKALRAGELSEAVKLVDRILLTRCLGLDFDVVQSLRDARNVLFTRRVARGKSTSAAN
jgi:hypothetical protein